MYFIFNKSHGGQELYKLFNQRLSKLQAKTSLAKMKFSSISSENILSIYTYHSATLTLDKVAKYQDNYQQFTFKLKNKKLIESISKADKMLQSKNKPKFEESKSGTITNKEETSSNKKPTKIFDASTSDSFEFLSSDKDLQIESESIRNLQDTFQPKCLSFEDLEFENLLSLLIQSQANYTQVIERIEEIKQSVMKQLPNNNNIESILNKNQGKILECIYQMLKQKKPEIQQLKINFEKFMKEFKKFLKLLKQTLINKYFNPEEVFQDLQTVIKNKQDKKMLNKLQSLQKDNTLFQSQSNFSEYSEGYNNKYPYEQKDEEIKQMQKINPRKESSKVQKTKLKTIDKEEFEVPKTSTFKITKIQKSTSKQISIIDKFNQKEQEQEKVQISEQEPESPCKIREITKSEQQKNDDENLRKKVLRTFAKLILDIYKIENQKAQTLSLQIENRIRQWDNQMKRNYRECVSVLIKQLKTLSQSMQNQFNESQLSIESLIRHVEQMNNQSMNEFLLNIKNL